MKLRDKLLMKALNRIECLESQIEDLQRQIDDIGDGEIGAVTELNAAADDLNRAVSANPLPPS